MKVMEEGRVEGRKEGGEGRVAGRSKRGRDGLAKSKAISKRERELRVAGVLNNTWIIRVKRLVEMRVV